jgi:putative ABC transport system permease protein
MRQLSLGAAFILALGMSAATVMADMLDRLLLRPPAHIAVPERVARVYVGVPGAFGTFATYDTYESLSAALPDDLEGLAAYQIEQLSIGRDQDARQVGVADVMPAYFDIIRVTPSLGTLPTARDSAAAASHVAVISHALWQRQFGGSADVIGRALTLGTDAYTIVAVMPRGFGGLDGDPFSPLDVWVPFADRIEARYPHWQMNRNGFGLYLVARLRPAARRVDVETRATAAYHRLGNSPGQSQARVVFGDLAAGRGPDGSPRVHLATWIGMLSALVLLIACGNVGNLLLIQGLRRSHELLVKIALGATRARLIREIMLQGARLAGVAGAMALAMVVLGGSAVRELFMAPVLASAEPLSMRLVVITTALCAATTLLLSTAPAIRLTRVRDFVAGQMVVQRASRLIHVFVAVQVALTVPLIVGSGLFIVSLWHAHQHDLGFQTDHVVVIKTDLTEIGRAAESDIVHRQIQARVAQLPQVESTAMVMAVPLRMMIGIFLSLPAHAKEAGPTGATVYVNNADPSFFQVMGYRLLAGRFFDATDNRAGAAPVAVINETLARMLWPGESAIGKCFAYDKPCTQVVGVTADTQTFPAIAPATPALPMFVMPIGRKPTTTAPRSLLVRTVGDPRDALPLLRREAQAAGRDLPFIDIWPYTDAVSPMFRQWRLGVEISVVFGILSLLIAGAGLAIVTSYGVTRSARELGIRLAVGAQPGQLTTLILRRSLMPVLLGLAGGVGAAYAGGRGIAALLFAVEPTDVRIIGVTLLLLLIVSALAAWLPARRAASIDPASVLRAER